MKHEEGIKEIIVYLIYALWCEEQNPLDATIMIYYHKYLYMFRTSICPSSVRIQTYTQCTPSP